MRVLLHAPLHPSYWVYLMEVLKEHKFYIEPREDFQEGMTPRNHIKYTIVPRKECKEMDMDVQFVVLSGYNYLDEIYSLIKEFPLPTVWLSYWKDNIPEYAVKYPLIAGNRFRSNTEYSNIRYTHVPPSRKLWSKNWKGDIPKVFIPAQRYLEPGFSHTFLHKLMKELRNTKLELDVLENAQRLMQFDDWRWKFIHERVLLDASDKLSSFVIEEAMMVGMPIVTRNINEQSLLVRDKVDGLTIWDERDLIQILTRFLTDYEYAKEWSEKSKARGKEILLPNKTREVLNKAMGDAIRLFKNSKEPFKRA